MKNKSLFFLILFLVTIFSSAVLASSQDDILSRWSKTQVFESRSTSGKVSVSATYYSAEYIETLIQTEAQKNLWTSDEMENYKYELLKTLQIEDSIPVLLKFENRGPSMHMAPFGDQVVLWLGKNKLEPLDYDRRFNFKLIGEREGFVYFPRYDPETGDEYLKDVKTAKLSIRGSVSDIIDDHTFWVDFIWDVYRDDPGSLYKGRAASQLELDRLIQRLENLAVKKNELESQLSEIQDEIDTINTRIEELQKQ